MAASKRSRKKATTRRKKQARKRTAVASFTATRKVTAIPRLSDGDVWVRIGPIWIQRGMRPGEDVSQAQRIKQAALKALKKFRG